MTISADVRGVDTLVATLDAALADLQNLEVDPTALEADAVAGAPRKSGALAATVEAIVTPTGLALTAGGPTAPHARPVLDDNPWLFATLRNNTATITTAVADEVATIVSTIKGI